MNWKLLGTLFLFAAGIPCTRAQSIEISARSSTEKAALDEIFKIVYTVNVEGKFSGPDLSSFRVLSGPNKSTFSSIEIINGRYNQKVSNSYTYMIRGKKEGTFTIQPASIIVDGKSYKSNSITVTITKAHNGSGGNDNGTPSAANNKYAFTSISLSRGEVYEGEPVLATYRLYTVFDRNTPEDLKFGAQPGCWIQEVKPGKNGWSPSLENFNGRRYNSFILKKDILIPQKSGNIQLEAFDLSMVSQVNFFESRRFDMVSNSPTLKVKPLPSPQPEGFTGAVGKYALNTRISAEKIKVNDPVDILVTLEGSGNIKLVSLPEIRFPADFEKFDPELNEKITVSESGMKGSKEFKFLFIPRHAGKYSIPKTPFPYFDVETGKYVTLFIPAFDINVTKEDGTEVAGNESNGEKEDVRLLENDIRYLKKVDESSLKKDFFTGSRVYFISLACIPVMFMLAFLLIRRKSDEAMDRDRLLRSVSREITQLLTESRQALASGQASRFYDVTGRALQLQLLKKTGIEATSLSSGQLSEQLMNRHFTGDTAREAAELFSLFESARYGLQGSATEMQSLYTRTENLIITLNKPGK